MELGERRIDPVELRRLAEVYGAMWGGSWDEVRSPRRSAKRAYRFEHAPAKARLTTAATGTCGVLATPNCLLSHARHDTVTIELYPLFGG